VKEHQKISVAATLHVTLDNLSRIEAILEQPSDFHEIVCDDVPMSRRRAIHNEVYELRRIIEDMFGRFGLSPKEVSRQRSVAAYAMLTANNFYELATRFQEASEKLSKTEALALETCCTTIEERLKRIIDEVVQKASFSLMCKD
jgi:polyhydroxyalkanoate synthesis regulator phasin